MIELQIYEHYDYDYNWKLYTKVIKRSSEGSLGLDRQSVIIRREAQVLLI
jgi:hypothetical protein